MTPTGFIVFLIGCYRLTLSPVIGNCCRFVPSCSSYALDALEYYPLPKAFGLIIWRIMRCNPFCKGGLDPIPGTEAKYDSR